MPLPPVTMIRHIALSFTAVFMTLAIQAQPKPSAKFIQAMQAYAVRLQAGDSSDTAIIQELEPLATNGDAIAQFMLASGFLLEKNPTRADNLLRRSAKAGCAGAAGILGLRLLETNEAEAMQFITFAAEHGDAASMVAISSFYKFGIHGYPKSIPHALAWCELSRRQGYSKGLLSSLENEIPKLRSQIPTNQLAVFENISSSLIKKYPIIPYYLGGQSLP